MNTKIAMASCKQEHQQQTMVTTHVKTILHFQEIPKDNIKQDHVIAILGTEKGKDSSADQNKSNDITNHKRDLRKWVNEQIKKQLLAMALEIEESAKYSAVGLSNRPICCYG